MPRRAGNTADPPEHIARAAGRRHVAPRQIERPGGLLCSGPTPHDGITQIADPETTFVVITKDGPICITRLET